MLLKHFKIVVNLVFVVFKYFCGYVFCRFHSYTLCKLYNRMLKYNNIYIGFTIDCCDDGSSLTSPSVHDKQRDAKI
jgi:hypothetical protein